MTRGAALLDSSVDPVTATTAAPETSFIPMMTAAPGSAAGGRRPGAARVKRQIDKVIKHSGNFQGSAWKVRAPAFTTQSVKTDLTARTPANTECAAQDRNV